MRFFEEIHVASTLCIEHHSRKPLSKEPSRAFPYSRVMPTRKARPCALSFLLLAIESSGLSANDVCRNRQHDFTTVIAADSPQTNHMSIFSHERPVHIICS